MRILYVHGLESIYGRKAQALAKHHDVLCPDMQVRGCDRGGEGRERKKLPGVCLVCVLVSV